MIWSLKRRRERTIDSASKQKYRGKKSFVSMQTRKEHFQLFDRKTEKVVKQNNKAAAC